MGTQLTLIAALLLSCGMAVAQQEEDPTQKDPGSGEATSQVEEEKPPLTIEGELTWVSAYFDDGYNLGDDGLFLQPSVTVAYEIFTSDQLTMTPYLNLWANVTDEKYDRTDYFDELDVALGSDVTYEQFAIGLQYIYYTSPGDTFDDIHEIGASLGFDDSVFELPVTLNPYVGVYYQLINKNATNGSFIELGLEPSYEIERVPLTISLPMATAFNLHNYYYNEDGGHARWGYSSIAIAGKVDVGENWFVAASAEYLSLIAFSTRESNDGNSNEWVYKATVGFSY